MFRPLLLGPALALALLLSACGGENSRMIPQDQAQALTEKVDEIAQKTSDEDCDGAEAAAQEARAQVTELPQRVSVRLKANLTEWVNHLTEEIPKDCKPEPEDTPTPEPSETPAETPSPSATPDDTPTPEPTPDATETPPPDEEPVPPVEPPGTGGVTPEDEGG